jgi:predicted negative regulator of RcsB-dependent stress response
MITETEAELLQNLKQWFKKYGKLTIITMTIFLSIGIGWYAAKRQHNNKLANASILYEELLNSLYKDDTKQISILAKQLINTYNHTPYAKLGALILAKHYIQHGDLNAAKTQLMWVMEKAEIPAVRQIARLRIARILLTENKRKEALQTLNTVDDPSLSPLIDEVRGDVHKALGKTDAAHRDYEKSLNNWPNNIPGKGLLQLKAQFLPK